MMPFESRQIHCTNCSYEGKGKVFTEGNFAFELIMYCFFIIPGIIYTLWRTTFGRHLICPDCKSKNVIKLKVWRSRQAANTQITR